MVIGVRKKMKVLEKRVAVTPASDVSFVLITHKVKDLSKCLYWFKIP